MPVSGRLVIVVADGYGYRAVGAGCNAQRVSNAFPNLSTWSYLEAEWKPPVYWIARLCSLNIWPGHALAFPPPPPRGHHQVPILYLFLLSSVSVRHPNLQPESIHHIHSHPYRFIPPSLLVLPLTPAFFALFLLSPLALFCFLLVLLLLILPSVDRFPLSPSIVL